MSVTAALSVSSMSGSSDSGSSNSSNQPMSTGPLGMPWLSRETLSVPVGAPMRSSLIRCSSHWLSSSVSVGTARWQRIANLTMLRVCGNDAAAGMGVSVHLRPSDDPCVHQESTVVVDSRQHPGDRGARHHGVDQRAFGEANLFAAQNVRGYHVQRDEGLLQALDPGVTFDQAAQARARHQVPVSAKEAKRA